MDEKLNKISGGIKALVVINSLLAIFIGICLIFRQEFFVNLIFAVILVHGIEIVIRYITVKEARNNFDLCIGILSVLLGSFLLFSSPGAKIIEVFIFEIIFSIWILFAGIGKVIDSFNFKKEEKKNIWGIIGGILMALCGLLFIAKPILGAISLIFVFSIFAGVSLIITGITGIVSLFLKKKD